MPKLIFPPLDLIRFDYPIIPKSLLLLRMRVRVGYEILETKLNVTNARTPPPPAMKNACEKTVSVSLSCAREGGEGVGI